MCTWCPSCLDFFPPGTGEPEKLYHPSYLLEGDELLPKYVAELGQAQPEEVRAGFLGYTKIVPAEKLQSVRQFEPEWGKFYNDDGIVLSFLAEQAEFSQYLQEECAKNGLAYFDCSADFMGTIEAAYRFLIGEA